MPAVAKGEKTKSSSSSSSSSTTAAAQHSLCRMRKSNMSAQKVVLKRASLMRLANMAGATMLRSSAVDCLRDLARGITGELTAAAVRIMVANNLKTLHRRSLKTALELRNMIIAGDYTRVGRASATVKKHHRAKPAAAVAAVAPGGDGVTAASAKALHELVVASIGTAANAAKQTVRRR